MVQAQKEAAMNLPDGWDAEELARAKLLGAKIQPARTRKSSRRARPGASI